MRTPVAAILIWTLSAAPAAAGGLDLAEWCRRAEALVQSLLDGGRSDPEIIPAPQGVDRQMARVPPQPHGAMRMIVPPTGR